ncbi:E-selectin-like isoform X2 [Genypterus blacodes]|uniref:E-selectin-like isoform X2 n=1 Tax=Genypterus blacodes TaxID=154954 RepID=UPI003F766F94
MRLSLILLFLHIWGNVDMSLSQNACLGLPKVPHASVSVRSKKNEYAQGDVVYFTCETGYITGPTIKYECTSQGWRVVRPGPCYLRPCGLPDNTPNGYYQLIHGEDFVFGASVRYFCNEGYYMVSKQDTRACLLNTWSSHVPVCEPSSCEPPPTDLEVTVRGLPENDDVILADRFLTFSCNQPGKALNGSAQLICGKDGQWSRPFPSCEDINCKAEPADALLNINGLTSANELMKIGHKLQFSCYQEYLLEGSEEVECLESGQWNKPFPTCFEGCQSPVQVGKGKLRKGEKLTFQCQPGQYLHGKAEIECLANGQFSDDIPTCGDIFYMVIICPEMIISVYQPTWRTFALWKTATPSGRRHFEHIEVQVHPW